LNTPLLETSAEALRASGYDRSTRHIIMYPDLNGGGRLFGGRLLEWLDVGVAGYIADLTGRPSLVTVRVGEVIFEEPGELNDHVEIWCRARAIGRTSITVVAHVMVNPAGHADLNRICSSELTFVHTDKEGSPAPWPEIARQRVKATWE
jgi:acyl-CoA hydrolase